MAPDNKIFIQYEPRYKQEPLNTTEVDSILKVWNGIISFNIDFKIECNLYYVDPIQTINKFPKFYDKLIRSGNIKCDSCCDFLKVSMFIRKTKTSPPRISLTTYTALTKLAGGLNTKRKEHD